MVDLVHNQLRIRTKCLGVQVGHGRKPDGTTFPFLGLWLAGVRKFDVVPGDYVSSPGAANSQAHSRALRRPLRAVGVQGAVAALGATSSAAHECSRRSQSCSAEPRVARVLMLADFTYFGPRDSWLIAVSVALSCFCVVGDDCCRKDSQLGVQSCGSAQMVLGCCTHCRRRTLLHRESSGGCLVVGEGVSRGHCGTCSPHDHSMPRIRLGGIQIQARITKRLLRRHCLDSPRFRQRDGERGAARSDAARFTEWFPPHIMMRSTAARVRIRRCGARGLHASTMRTPSIAVATVCWFPIGIFWASPAREVRDEREMQRSQAMRPPQRRSCAGYGCS